jgi:hypothetical protein
MIRTPTFWLMRVWIWLACWAASFEPSVIFRSTSEYLPASFLAFSLMAFSQPWSACGPANPMVTFLPGAAFAPVAAAVPTSLLSGSALLVQAEASAAEVAHWSGHDRPFDT